MASDSPPRFDDSEDEDDFHPAPADLSDEEPIDNESNPPSNADLIREHDDAPKSDDEDKDGATGRPPRDGEDEDNEQNNEEVEDEEEQDDDEEDEEDEEDEDVQQVFYGRDQHSSLIKAKGTMNSSSPPGPSPKTSSGQTQCLL